MKKLKKKDYIISPLISVFDSVGCYAIATEMVVNICIDVAGENQMNKIQENISEQHLHISLTALDRINHTHRTHLKTTFDTRSPCNTVKTVCVSKICTSKPKIFSILISFDLCAAYFFYIFKYPVF